MKKQTIIFGVLLISLGLMAQNPKKLYKSGVRLLEAKQYNEAITEFSKAIDLNNAYVDAYVARAQSYEKIDNLELCAKDYEKALELEPQVVDYIFEAGKVNYRVKNYEKALKFLTETVILDNQHFQAYQFKSFTHIKLGDYKNAIVAIDNALAIQKTYVGNYTRGVANDSLKNYPQAISDYNKAIGLSPNFEKAYYALSKVYVKNGDLDLAVKNATRSVQKFPEAPDAYETRSQVYYDRNELPEAINDLSKLETLVDDAKQVLFTRGIYYFEYKQYQNAKSDFSQILALSSDNYEALYWRGRSNEELMEIKAAEDDYAKYMTRVNTNGLALAHVSDAEHRLYEIKREEEAPVVRIENPKVLQHNKLAVLNETDRLVIDGKVEDESEISHFKINNQTVEIGVDKTFSYALDIIDINLVTIELADVYNNKTVLEYHLLNMEADAPIVRITTPYAGDNNEIYLDSDDANLFLEGFVEDASIIKDVFIDSVRATFNDTELNPQFSAMVNIENKSSIRIKAVDAFANVIETVFTLNREGAVIAESNPMGKTWVVFIENSNYETFASLEGPTKDVSSMKNALSSYEIHNFIHKKDMSKKEMERFFSIELRDQVKKNNVNSLMVWYAGHGKFINETGYWIPVDATRDDEFTYFNINSLKAGMQSYSGYITHTLVVTDACESGPSFYQAMRSTPEIRACDDINATKFKSSQVFSSAGYELASDNSQFTKTFAKSLQFNEGACIPIESIVSKVTEATTYNENQKPLFGKIAGFEDENGTFFFIKK
jgi:tetratricopeptide (TPR) repeat protein